MGTWYVLGAGFTGGYLAQRLVTDGHDVIVTRRSPGSAMAAALAVRSPRACGIVADLAQPASIVIPDGAVVVCLAPPGAEPAREIAGLVQAADRAARLVYVSSTGVYGPGYGQWIDETAPIAPITSAGRARAIAEESVPASAIRLRVAGIYGPGRGLVERIRAGTYRIVGDGSAHVSRIHVVDLVEAIVRAGSTGVTGPVNVADDDPAPIGIVADTIAAQLGLPAPPRVAAASVDSEVAGMLTADRRIANTRMKHELGVVLRYPSWRTLIASATDAGA